MKICVVSLRAYNVLFERTGVAHIGGAETQIVAVGRALRNLGHEVSFVVMDYGQPDGAGSKGIKAYKTYALDEGLPGLRFFHPRGTGTWRALKRADADVYVQEAADSLTGLVGMWCRRNRRRFVFVSMSDNDCRRSFPNLDTRRDRWLARRGLRDSDGIITQTEVQRRMLEDEFGLESTVIGPCCLVKPSANGHGEESRDLLWVGRFSPTKRAEWFVELCGFFPELTGYVAGAGNDGSAYAAGVARKLATAENVVACGAVDHKDMRGFYKRAALLVCTSSLEGFPTIFLEAWATGTPVVTTFDPDGIVERESLGLVAGDVPGLRDCIGHLLSNPQTMAEMSERARRYVAENHSPEQTAKRFESVLLGSKGESGRASSSPKGAEG